MKANDFITRLNKAVSVNTVYMWGTFGGVVTQTLIDTKTRQYPAWYTPTKRAALAKQKGAFAFDCIGLIKGILWGWNADSSKTQGGSKYGSNGVPDTNANGFFKNLCKGQSQDFSTIVPGEAVWMNGHIGVYIGNGRVIEATPSWRNGVQITACLNIAPIPGLNGRKWTAHGRIPYIEYNTTSTQFGQPKVTADALNIRMGAGTNFPILATLKKGDAVTVLDTKGDWVQLSAWVSGKYLSFSKGKVTASVLNVRSGPGTNYSVLSQLQKGAEVQVLDKVGDWYRIHQGYVHSNYVALL